MSFSFAMAQKTDPFLSKLQKKLDKTYLDELVISTDPNTTMIPVYNMDIEDNNFVSKIDDIMETLPISPFIGSNAWVIGANKTAKGKVIFNNDPHIKYSQPGVWYQSHIVCPDFEMYGYKNQFSQVLLNILNNAKDALIKSNITNKLIFVNIYKDDKNIIIDIKDNAGGIEDSIIDKVFDPYFTTNHQSQGKGLGLYTSLKIITKLFNGTIEVENDVFKYDENSYKGAKFKIKIPIVE